MAAKASSRAGGNNPSKVWPPGPLAYHRRGRGGDQAPTAKANIHVGEPASTDRPLGSARHAGDARIDEVGAGEREGAHREPSAAEPAPDGEEGWARPEEAF